MAEPAIIPVERRGATRVPVLFPVPFDRDGNLAGEVWAANISATGMLVRAEFDLPVWARFTAALPGAGMREVRIVRRQGSDYGCLFQTPLEPEELDAVLGSDVAQDGMERLRAEAEAPAPKPKGLLRLWRR